MKSKKLIVLSLPLLIAGCMATGGQKSQAEVNVRPSFVALNRCMDQSYQNIIKSKGYSTSRLSSDIETSWAKCDKNVQKYIDILTAEVKRKKGWSSVRREGRPLIEADIKEDYSIMVRQIFTGIYGE